MIKRVLVLAALAAALASRPCPWPTTAAAARLRRPTAAKAGGLAGLGRLRLGAELDRRFQVFSGRCLVASRARAVRQGGRSPRQAAGSAAEGVCTGWRARSPTKCSAASPPARCSKAGQVTQAIDALLAKVASDEAAIKAAFPERRQRIGSRGVGGHRGPPTSRRSCTFALCDPRGSRYPLGSAMAKAVEHVDHVIVRFAGDSGDGMQLTGDRFTSETAVLGNDLATFPDFPAEIRAPAGSLPGVSGFQVHFADHDILTPGDRPNVLVAMNPAALQDQPQGRPARRHADRQHGRLQRPQPAEGGLRREPARGRLARELPRARGRADVDDDRGAQGHRGRRPRARRSARRTSSRSA